MCIFCAQKCIKLMVYSFLSGVERHLDYLYDNNVTTVWMNSVFKSGGKALSNDIVDHKAVDPQFGTLDELKWLITSMHKKSK